MGGVSVLIAGMSSAVMRRGGSVQSVVELCCRSGVKERIGSGLEKGGQIEVEFGGWGGIGVVEEIWGGTRW